MTLRGKRLFENMNGSKNTAQMKKGRNMELVSERNKLLFYRYYFYQSQARLQYETVLNILSTEFFLSISTISQIVSENGSEILKIKKEKPSIKSLQSIYPAIVWDISKAAKGFITAV